MFVELYSLIFLYIPPPKDFFPAAPSGILYTWTGSGKIVCTGMYRYVQVYASTGIHLQYILARVCTGMYQKQDKMVSHPCSSLRENSNSIQLHCKRYAMMMSIFKKCQF